MKNLKLLFQCDNYTELADILGVRRATLYLWKNHGIPVRMERLLNLIEKQQTELIKLNRILIAIENNEIDLKGYEVKVTTNSSTQKD